MQVRILVRTCMYHTVILYVPYVGYLSARKDRRRPRDDTAPRTAQWPKTQKRHRVYRVMSHVPCLLLGLCYFSYHRLELVWVLLKTPCFTVYTVINRQRLYCVALFFLEEKRCHGIGGRFLRSFRAGSLWSRRYVICWSIKFDDVFHDKATSTRHWLT
jgi:hypothetical protein